MKRVLKLFVVIFILNQCFAYADFIKPDAKIKPEEVIKIQLKSLMKNDAPSKDNGIKQTWEFAHPNNQRFTGPLDNFTKMLKGDSYKMLIGHIGHEISELDNADLSSLTLPLRFVTTNLSFELIQAIPAESYPLYSNLFNPFNKIGWQFL